MTTTILTLLVQDRTIRVNTKVQKGQALVVRRFLTALAKDSPPSHGRFVALLTTLLCQRAGYIGDCSIEPRHIAKNIFREFHYLPIAEDPGRTPLCLSGDPGGLYCSVSRLPSTISSRVIPDGQWRVVVA